MGRSEAATEPSERRPSLIDHLPAVKANRPALHDEVERHFADVPAADLDASETTDGDHGRLEVRRHAVSRGVAWLATDRRSPGEPRSPGLAAIAMVGASVERPGKVSRERRHHLSSAPLDARLFARAVRGPRHIENRLHWVLEVAFRDDLCRLRTGHGPRNMAVVRHMAVKLLREGSGRHSSLKVRRKKAAWNPDYLAGLLRHTA